MLYHHNAPMIIKDEFGVLVRELSQGKRPRREWSEEQWDSLITTWRAELRAIPERETIMQILCIIEHSRPPYPMECQALLLEGMRHKKIDHELVVTQLGVSQKVIFVESYKRGEKVPGQVYECLKELLHLENAEVTEWVLRTLLEAGNEAACMLEDLEQIKVSWFKRISRTHKQINILRNKLIERWENLPRIT